MAGRMDGGQHAVRHLQRVQQQGVPGMVPDVEQHGARGVGHVRGMHGAPCQLPQQPAVHGAERQFAALGHLARAGHLIQQPAQLGGGKVRVHHQAGGLPDVGRQPVRAQLRAQGLAAAVLPDDGVVQRLPGAPVPQHRGLALVGDADGRHRSRGNTGLGEGLARRGQLRLPDLLGVMFHPARLREDLAELALRHGHHAALVIEDDAAGTGGALVQGQEVGHARGSFEMADELQAFYGTAGGSGAPRGAGRHGGPQPPQARRRAAPHSATAVWASSITRPIVMKP